ncbi:MAG: bifunctional UDP-N-acetylglucosamine diphosphorylase/glucosamine-1-phosphate N-acetyltransferase GlmU [Propionibacteriaceae bacterium]|jgi:bifunctional UDP-N-acetylglucosamine pyrophosphorylase/glucosamine-1-phosphate N-acetyltransferase|nr:bifunctional UDP-N-acetylglucosamine diphosphorylase/glucosamine-1-phosphate N-acetyltransferase GlmU [Propionibacteriaceae bacterium]
MVERDSSVAAVVLLAAGSGTRMKSSTSKLLHPLCGKSLLSWALGAAEGVAPEKLVVVVGHLKEQVEAHLKEVAPHALTAVQETQDGTGHAVRCAMETIEGVTGDIVVTYGDVPMLTGETLRRLVGVHRRAGNAVTVMTSILDNPTGYGRILRSGNDITGIVEERDADDAQKAIKETNSGIYIFDATILRDGLAQLKPDNDQNQLYLTDVVGYAVHNGHKVGAYIETDRWQTEGINDRAQLSAMTAELNRRIVTGWMLEGVTIIDPATTWIEAGVSIDQDVVLWPGTILCGATSIASGAVIGPDTRLTDVEVGAGASVVRSEAILAVIGEDANVGPFSYLRPGTTLGREGKIGAYVETKNAQIGDDAKVPHLTYCGDAVIGAGTNIGAGTIFANYDGTTKSVTTVGRNAFVGSQSVLVAPVHIGDDAFVAAGSALTGDVAEGELAVARGRQRNIAGWVTAFRDRTRGKKAASPAPTQGEGTSTSTDKE